MKDIEELLHSIEKKQPRRHTSSQFVAEVLRSVKDGNRMHKSSKSPFIRFAHQPFMVSIAVIAALATGTAAYATVVNWPTVKTFFDSQHTLSSGNRVVRVKTEGCDIPKDAPADASGYRYYEIRKDSKISSEQVVGMVQGLCEEQQIFAQVGALGREIVKNNTGGSISSISFLKIAGLSKDSITVVSDPARPEVVSATGPKTYTVASDVRVMDGAAAMQYADLKVGDTVTLINSDARGISTEKKGYTEDLSSIQVRGVLKTPPAKGDASMFYNDLGKEFVRVEPEANGFKRMYEFEP